jgi:2-polyprenyl-3-methyl-5-hydroxy-6-metoxy-1,4-benzoquinol methylase/cytochrome c-type biogenesis protein CcmH/NrfG
MLREEIGASLKAAIRLHEKGAVMQAEQICRQILAIDSNTADAWNMLAVALCQQNCLDAAAKAAERATALRPKIAPYWLTRGNIAAARRSEREAQSSFRWAIEINPDFTEAHYWLGRSCQREGKLTDAIAAYRAARRGVPEVAEIHYHLARALLEADRWHEALQAYQQAFARDPEGSLDRRECLDRFRFLEFDSLPEFWHAEVTRFFRREDVDKSRYAMVGLRVLMAKRAFRAVRAAAEALGPFEPDAAALDEVMRDELFELLLRDALIAQPEFEVLLTRLRAALLLDGELRARAPSNFLCDLALQCFNNEFIFAEAQAESTQVTELQCAIEATLRDPGAVDERLMRSVATLAMYRPLHAMSGVDTLLAREPMSAGIERLIHRSVRNVLEERRLRSSICAVGGITAAVSQAVRAQYEENPYPRWFSFDRMPPVSTAEWIESEVPGLQTSTELPAALRLLVAGCGTGIETLGLATQIVGVQVTAVDLSLSSLAYAQRKANELGVTNVEFQQADILELAKWPERFDIVYCVGVLMAMRDPQAGLRALLPLVRPGGLLKLGLYSKRARASVNVAREIIRQQRLPATASAIREFRQYIYAAKQGSPLKSLLRWRDFYSMSDCRDFLFHVQEHQLDLPQVSAMLRDHGLTVLGMSKQLPRHAVAAYRRVFPRDKTLVDLQQWDAVETRFPETFLGMYQVWCRKPAISAAS